MPKTKKTDTPFINGTLIIVEGIDGSGKSTQLVILKNLLEASGFAVELSEWNSSLAIKPLNKKVKAQRDKKDLVHPRTFHLTHAADMADRYVKMIKGSLKAGKIVLCDRYMYTDIARSVARGADEAYIRKVYQFLPKPDLAFYFQVPTDIAVKRATGRADLKFYEAGMDLGLSENILENFHLFQSKVIANYERLAKQDKLIVIDGTKPIYETTPIVKKYLRDYIKNKYSVTMM
ncbi:MAG: dTMP kinase [Candidatus Abawacabacteria bacterium]|nr:dTMP kinase [Candidatus Abawacabacteria bacterium]